jgi:hypothetical protein
VDEEISKLVRNVVRCGSDAIQATILQLKTHLGYSLANEDEDNHELPHCRLRDHRCNDYYVGDHIFGYANTRIDGNFLLCKTCHKKVASSIQVCSCAWREKDPNYVYMIGDRDYMRTRCKNCHAIVGGMWE